MRDDDDPFGPERQRMAAERWILNAVTSLALGFAAQVVVVHVLR